ncbi:unnamed protein product [Mytilus coruscus]|uniref:Integrase catalytic domain-containing protein n=1 Tax=Mytilus coruscus TaxID=42192 RepID=A0A6J8BRQ4_MYTCO|nr:unnamed protein product [Mytilus coruscus]
MNLDNNRPDVLVSDKHGTFDNNYVSMCQSSLLNNFINVNIGSLSMHAMIHTGADISVANPSILSKLDSVGRSLSKQEQQFGITEKECLALVYAVKKFDCYLRFTKFTAYVDHSALKWLFTLKEPTGKFARWIALLQSYNMEILYRPGTTHGNADGVSRREYDNVTDQDMESLIDILPYGAVIVKTGNNVKIIKMHFLFVRKITDNDNIELDNTTKESVNMFPMAQLKVEQRKDTYFKNIITFLESGHLGINRTIQKTQRSFFWPSIGSDVADWDKSYELRSQRKRPQKSTKSPITSMPIASQQFERVSTDILGPVSNSGTSKNQYIEVDYLSDIIKETGKLLDIKKTQTTSYRPQCNGQSERMMSTIKDMLSKYIEDNSDWDRYIPFIQFAYNASPSIDSADYSPFFLVNGRHLKSFLDTH